MAEPGQTGSPAPAGLMGLDTGEEAGRVAGISAYVLFIGLGALLVFWFASALRPAVTAQAAAPCRSLRPEAREGAAPAFTVQDLDGKPVALADFAGKFVIVNFWATWCEPCIREWPQLDRLAERFAGRDEVVILAVSMDKEPGALAPFLARMGLENTGVKVLWDPEQSVQKAFGTTNLPDTYFVDRAGQLREAFINVREWGRPAAYQCVESMLRD